jgi:GTP-dependent phosphoenolpyruvate carboxykinase
MSRIPTHTVEDAPAASRPLFQKIVQSTPTGRPANLHAQMAHSPAVLTAYTSLRAVLGEHTTFDPKVGAALTLATAAGVGNDYMIRIASRLAHMNGWVEEQVIALRKGIPTSDVKIDALTGLVREAAANSGNVTDATWKAAQQAGWSVEQLTDAFAYVGATVFTGYFLNYAQTDMDALW